MAEGLVALDGPQDFAAGVVVAGQLDEIDCGVAAGRSFHCDGLDVRGGVDVGGLQKETDGLFAAGLEAVEVAELVQCVGLTGAVTAAGLAAERLLTGLLGGLELPGFRVDVADLVPCRGHAAWFAELLERLTDFVPRGEGLGIPPLQQPDRAELAFVGGDVSQVTTFLVNLDQFLVHVGGLDAY